jgi:lysophospholipase L1-like esterase
MFLGDSTATDQIGYGQEHMNWRRWLWHLHFGHTPATQLCRLGNFGGTPSAEFIFTGTIAYPQPGVIPSSYLPPGYSGGASFSQALTGAAGMHIQINHQNDNHLTQSCPSSPNGFYHVLPAVNQGDAAFAIGSVAGGKSLIDLVAGVRVEVLALTHPNSAPTIRWNLIPQIDFCATDNFATTVQTGVLFGGGQSLNAPIGTVYRSQTPPLNVLTGQQRYIRVNVTGNTTDPAAAVQFVGARFLSNNPTGLITDSFSAGGYSATSMTSLHANCGPVIAAGGYSCAWIMYGLNDQSTNTTAMQFQSNVQNVIAFVRSAAANPQLPIVLETNTMKVGETEESRHYAGALLNIAQIDQNVLLINSRRVAEDRFNWGTPGGGSEAQYLADGVHYTNAGAEAIARSSIETILDYFQGDPGECLADTNQSGAVDIDDLLAVVNAWNWSGNPSAHPADVTADGVVNIDDLLFIINSWGLCN